MKRFHILMLQSIYRTSSKLEKWMKYLDPSEILYPFVIWSNLAFSLIEWFDTFRVFHWLLFYNNFLYIIDGIDGKNTHIPYKKTYIYIIIMAGGKQSQIYINDRLPSRPHLTLRTSTSEQNMFRFLLHLDNCLFIIGLLVCKMTYYKPLLDQISIKLMQKNSKYFNNPIKKM